MFFVTATNCYKLVCYNTLNVTRQNVTERFLLQTNMLLTQLHFARRVGTRIMSSCNSCLLRVSWRQALLQHYVSDCMSDVSQETEHPDFPFVWWPSRSTFLVPRRPVCTLAPFALLGNFVMSLRSRKFCLLSGNSQSGNKYGP